MDDARCREFFFRPLNLYQRRYEALRAVFVEGRPQSTVADLFGFEHSSLRQLVWEFRQHCGNPSNASPFFANSKSDDQPQRRRPARRDAARTRFLTLRIARS